MNRSDTITKIAPALLKAQKNIGAATKGSSNPFFKSKYADLGSVMEACKDALNEAGISVLQPPVVTTGDRHAVETILLHESGEFFATTMMLELPKPNMQELGSAISYARRYSLQSMVFIPAEDDDGEKSMQRSNNQAKVAEAMKAAPAEKKTEEPPKRTSSFRRDAKPSTTAPAVTKPAVETEAGWE